MKFRVGDKVICKPGFNTIYEELSNMGGGFGYQDGLEFVILKYSHGCVLWTSDPKRGGIMEHACELVLPKPIIPWEDNVLKFKFI